MKISVSPLPQKFHIALTKGWYEVTGFLITIEDFKFNAVPVRNSYIISEVESGARVCEIHIPKGLERCRNSLFFLEDFVAVKVAMIINEAGFDKLKKETGKVKEYMVKNFGEKPLHLDESYAL